MRLLRSGVACLLVLGVFSATRAAGASSKLSEQETRLHRLESEARQKQAEVAQMMSSIKNLASQMRASDRALDDLDRSYQSHVAQLNDTVWRHDELQRQMNAAATDLYMRAPVSYIGVVMDAPTVSDASDAVRYVSQIFSKNRKLAAQTAAAARAISASKARDDAMISQRGALLFKQRTQQDALLDAFAAGQQRLQEIEAIRNEVIALIGQLRGGGVGGTMPYGEWASAFLSSVGAPVSRDNLVAMVAWQVAEGTLARWNPLATTWQMPGSAPFNGYRVQNYVSLEQGLEAVGKTLAAPGHGYEPILSNLRASASASTTAQAINASDWCHGCAGGHYVIELIPIVERYYDRYALGRA